MQLFSTPVRTVTINTQPIVSAQNPPILPAGSSQIPLTSKISVLFKDSNNVKEGYFGLLKILDDPEAFTRIFGDKPTILAPKIIILQDST